MIGSLIVRKVADPDMCVTSRRMQAPGNVVFGPLSPRGQSLSILAGERVP